MTDETEPPEPYRPTEEPMDAKQDATSIPEAYQQGYEQGYAAAKLKYLCGDFGSKAPISRPATSESIVEPPQPEPELPEFDVDEMISTSELSNDPEGLKKKLASAVNFHGWDNRCNVPDYILAKFLHRTLLTVSMMNRETRQHNGESTNQPEQPKQNKDPCEKCDGKGYYCVNLPLEGDPPDNRRHCESCGGKGYREPLKRERRDFWIDSPPYCWKPCIVSCFDAASPPDGTDSERVHVREVLPDDPDPDEQAAAIEAQKYLIEKYEKESWEQAAEIARLKEEIESANAGHDDEEAAHQETLSMLDKARAEIERLRKERDGWHSVVTECERVLKLEGTADSPLMSDLANAIRDVKSQRDQLAAELAELRKATEKPLQFKHSEP